MGSWAIFISWISPRNVEEKNWKLFLRVWRYFTIKIFLNFLIVPFPTTLERKKATKNETYGELFLFLPKIGSQKIETRKLECDTINIVFKPVTGLNISKFRLLCLFLCRSFMPVILILLKFVCKEFDEKCRKLRKSPRFSPMSVNWVKHTISETVRDVLRTL